MGDAASVRAGFPSRLPHPRARGGPERRRAVLTVDLEDYRADRMQAYTGQRHPGSPAEVERGVDRLLEIFDEMGARATFFTVARLVSELPPGVWQRITRRHRLGCHGLEHLPVRTLGPRRFERDLRAAREALQDASGQEVVAYRAPLFSSDACDPWFGEALARLGFRLDSSRRIVRPPPGFQGVLPLTGSGGAVTEVPLACHGVGSKRLTVMGGTYFRLLPLAAGRALMALAERKGFLPMIYLHPYDMDPELAPLDARATPHPWRTAWGDRMRTAGRAAAAAKLRALGAEYEFMPLEQAAAPFPMPRTACTSLESAP